MNIFCKTSNEFKSFLGEQTINFFSSFNIFGFSQTPKFLLWPKARIISYQVFRGGNFTAWRKFASCMAMFGGFSAQLCKRGKCCKASSSADVQIRFDQQPALNQQSEVIHVFRKSFNFPPAPKYLIGFYPWTWPERNVLPYSQLLVWNSKTFLKIVSSFPIGIIGIDPWSLTGASCCHAEMEAGQGYGK